MGLEDNSVSLPNLQNTSNCNFISWVVLVSSDDSHFLPKKKKKKLVKFVFHSSRRGKRQIAYKHVNVCLINPFFVSKILETQARVIDGFKETKGWKQSRFRDPRQIAGAFASFAMFAKHCHMFVSFLKSISEAQ